jgi:uncharacterized protein YkwD
LDAERPLERARQSEQTRLTTEIARSALAAARPLRPTTPTALEREVLAELNLLRKNPAAYARALEKMRGQYVGNILRRGKGQAPIKTVEGEPALLEAIAALRATRAMGPLEVNRALAAGARDHVTDQAPTGEIGHRGTDGSNSLHRISRYGRSDGMSAEVIDYGWDNARDIVIDLLIDDGIANRGHRINVLEPAYATAGVSCGGHKRFGVMCVVELAERFQERGDNAGMLVMKEAR